MANQSRKRNSRGMRNFRSAGWEAAKFTGRTADNAAVGLARWVTTDHSGMGKALENMPSMGFIDSVRYILVRFIISMIGVVLSGVGVFLLIAIIAWIL